MHEQITAAFDRIVSKQPAAFTARYLAIEAQRVARKGEALAGIDDALAEANRSLALRLMEAARDEYEREQTTSDPRTAELARDAIAHAARRA